MAGRRKPVAHGTNKARHVRHGDLEAQLLKGEEGCVGAMREPLQSAEGRAEEEGACVGVAATAAATAAGAAAGAVGERRRCVDPLAQADCE